MARTGPYNDSPGLIRSEGQTITLSFQKTGPTTGRVSWNIPAPSVGCDEDTQAYNGIVITLDTTTVDTSKQPVNETFYTGDATADSDIHAGDTIGTALVIGAFYDDKTTTVLDFTDLVANTPYYISAYAVDKQGRYHTAGVHAFSLPYGGETDPATPGYHEFGIGFQDDTAPFDIILHQGTVSGVRGSDSTGLDNTTTYCIELKVDDDTEFREVEINGANAQTYDDLIDELNKQIALLESPPQSATEPNTGSYFYDTATQKLFIFDGVNHNEVDVINNDTDPSSANIGDYWFNSDTSTLGRWDGGLWISQSWFSYIKDPVSGMDSSDNWFNGTSGYRWEGVTWCEKTTHIQTIDPTLPTTPVTGSYWYDTTNEIVKMWDESCNDWVEINVLANDTDPEDIVTGSYWYNFETETLYVRNVANDGWDEFAVRFEISTTEPAMPADGMAWFNPDTDELNIRTAGAWVLTPVIIHFEDPATRESCDYWWNTSTDVLYIWDSLTSSWDQVNSFVLSATDPTAGVTPTKYDFWYNNTTLYQWDGAQWVAVNYINFATNPNEPAIDDHWYDSINNQWKVWDGAQWVNVDVLTVDSDPNTPSTGEFWYDTDDNVLYQFNGVTWVSILFQTTLYTPVTGFVYYNTTDEVLYEWTGSSYTPATLFVRAELNTRGNVVFISGTTGSGSIVCVQDCGDNTTTFPLFDSLTENVKYYDPQIGDDGVSGTPSYDQMGVGTDGSSDERRNLIRSILLQLGQTGVDVELSKDQLEECVRMSLMNFRQRSASAYKRVFFFLNIKPGQQHYRLTDQTVGFHKVTEVMAAYRIQSSFLGNATGQGAYGQAMLQHLYQMGSFDLLSYHIISDYVELMNHLFAAYLVFTWDEESRMLHFHQTFGSNERVLLDVTIERTEQELMTNRITRPWIERYALGCAQLMLAEIRGKFGSLPGAGGGVTLNAQDLQVKGEANIEFCNQQLEDFTANEIESVGYEGSFILG